MNDQHNHDHEVDPGWQSLDRGVRLMKAVRFLL